MVFVALQASVFHSAACWMEEWPGDILSAQSLNVVMLVICFVRFKTLKNGKCVSQTWESRVECDISVIQC